MVRLQLLLLHQRLLPLLVLLVPFAPADVASQHLYLKLLLHRVLVALPLDRIRRSKKPTDRLPEQLEW